jgi:hypothetical protein
MKSIEALVWNSRRGEACPVTIEEVMKEEVSAYQDEINRSIGLE